MEEFFAGIFALGFICVAMLLVILGFDFVVTHGIPAITISILGGVVVIGIAASAVS